MFESQTTRVRIYEVLSFLGVSILSNKKNIAWRITKLAFSKKGDFSKRISNHHDLPSGVEFFKEEINDCSVASDAQSFEYRASDLVNVAQYNRGEKDFR